MNIIYYFLGTQEGVSCDLCHIYVSELSENRKKCIVFSQSFEREGESRSNLAGK